MTEDRRPTVYWHRELPPLRAEICGNGVVEAVSHRVAGSFSHRDSAWNQCYADLMARAGERVVQEVARRGARYAHIADEDIEPRHDDATGETWLYGRFGCVFYRDHPKPLRT